jgi:lipopolysaccharide transport system permease protein
LESDYLIVGSKIDTNGRQRTGGFMKIGYTPFLLIYKYRKILFQTTLNDIKGRYAGSVLGLLWLLLYPLLLLFAYSFVYLYIFKVRFGMFNSEQYVMLIFSGLIPFLGFTEGIAMGIPSVTANSGLIKNTLFPIDIIPIKAVLFSQCTQVVGLLLLLIALVVSKGLSFYAILIIPIWLLQILFTIGVTWILSGLNVYFRDLQNIITLITLFLMMVSPIAYSADMIPQSLQPFLKGNPLYYLIVSYQDSLILGQFPRGNVFYTLVIMSVATFIIGYWFFNKLKALFADNI